MDANSHGNSEIHGPTVLVEQSISDDVLRGLQDLGHKIEVLKGYKRNKFGKGQVIRRHVDDNTGVVVWSGGSDQRRDGCAMPA